jgi:type IV secretion system protein VirD4
MWPNNLNHTLTMIDSLFKVAENFLEELLTGNSHGKPGLEDLKNFVSRRNTGLTLDGSNQLQDEKMSCRNALVCGTTGSGKSSTYIFPNLFADRGAASYFTTDPSGEISAIAAPVMANMGIDVKIINLDNVKYSNLYNPMARLRGSYSDCKQLASLIIKSTLGDGKGNEIFWQSSAANLISCFIYIVSRLDEQYRHLSMVLNMINGFASGNKKVDEIAIKNCDSLVWQEFRALKGCEPKLMQNIISTAKVSLTLWTDENISYLTCKDNLDFTQLRNRPTAIFVVGNSLKAKYFSPVFSCITSQIFQYLLGEIPSNNSLPVYFLLDEMASYYISDIDLILSVNRKYKISISVALQAKKQLNSIYSDRVADVILSNLNTELYYTNQDLETCKKISEIAGYYYAENEDGKKVKEQVLPIETIRTMPANNAILLQPASKPIYITELYPYYKDKKLMKKIESTPPFTIQASEDFTGITPILNLNDYAKS